MPETGLSPEDNPWTCKSSRLRKSSLIFGNIPVPRQEEKRALEKGIPACGLLGFLLHRRFSWTEGAFRIYGVGQAGQEHHQAKVIS